jgi:hypothetical protein
MWCSRVVRWKMLAQTSGTRSRARNTSRFTTWTVPMSLALRRGLDGQTTQGEGVVHRFPFQLAQVGIASRRGRSRQEEEASTARRRAWAVIVRVKPLSLLASHLARRTLPSEDQTCLACARGKRDKPSTSGDHLARSRTASRRIHNQPDVGKKWEGSR